MTDCDWMAKQNSIHNSIAENMSIILVSIRVINTGGLSSGVAKIFSQVRTDFLHSEN